MKYILTEKSITSESKKYVSYGIACEIEHIDDISTELELVEKIVGVLNEGHVQAIHFKDVVVDMLIAHLSL